MSASTDRWFTVQDLERRWDVSSRTVLRRIASGLQALRGRDGGYRVREDWLLKWEDTESRKQAKIPA